MESFWLYLTVGLLSGMLSAMFGIGAGVVMVPTLILVAGLPQKSAQGVALAVMAPIALVGAIRYKLNPENAMDMRMILWMAIGGFAGALIGSWLVNLPIIRWAVLRRAFAVLLLIAAVKMFFAPEKKTPARPPASADAGPSNIPPDGSRASL
ncbi:MAG: sulfite exporter TauE/SafE family protein [Verrucomicrobiota bacterium]|nr:sulfite exporter TauE/SafE family protein [Verrucomicrobiota bacterium]